MKYTTKPATVEAIQFFPDTKFPTEFGLTDYLQSEDRSLLIVTENGERRCDFGDWIVRHPKNGFTVVKRADFGELFSPAPTGTTR